MYDADFSNQDAVFKDLQEKYGKRNVAHVVTFGRMTPKAVLRKVLSAFSWEQYKINAISKLLSDDSTSIEEEMSKNAELRDALNSTIEGYAPHTYLEVIKVLENVISHEGVHAGGVVIYEDLARYAPVKRDKDNHDNYIIAMDKYEVETNGFYKFDVLGLETISVISDALSSIKDLHGISIDWNTIDRDDEKVYDMLSKGNVSGIFQLANQGDKVVKQKPRNFLDLIAINALIRPDTEFEEYLLRRAGKEWSVHQNRMYYMEETFGLHVYQEQYLLDAKVLAGWDLAFADKNIRKNKNLAKDEAVHALFIRNAVERGYELNMLEEVWQSMVVAATAYGFNKSHAAAYAIVAFQTAWLKCYFPIEFYSALMTKFGGETDEVANLISEAKRLGIKILPPNINYGTDKFVPTKEGIQYRITTINTIGDKTLEDIYKKRPFTSLDDLMLRRDTQLLNNTNVKNLIKCGAMDWTGEKRNYMLWQVDMLLRKKTEIKNNVILPMHPDGYDHIYEFDSLGIYLTRHPMEGKGQDFEKVEDETNCTVYGIIFEVAVTKQKNGKEMAFVTLNTATGNVKVLVFAHMYTRIKENLEKGVYIWVKGKKSKSALLLDSVGGVK